jgi:anti-sigma factor RsiW
MTWRTPQTEAEWQEALSAYVDDELPSEDARGVEAACAADPLRGSQLESLRATRAMLQAWNPDAPSPTPDFLAELSAIRRSSTGRRTRKARIPVLRILSYAAVALVGIAIGAVGSQALRVDRNNRAAIAPPDMVSTATPVSVDADRAESLMREVRAESLKGKLVTLMTARDWTQASNAYDDLVTAWGDTDAASAVRVDPAFDPLRQWRVLHRRT